MAPAFLTLPRGWRGTYTVGETLSSAEAFNFKRSDIEPIDTQGQPQRGWESGRYTLKEKGMKFGKKYCACVCVFFFTTKVII